MKEVEFNLLDEPWVRVLCPDCTVREVSLTDALLHAHEYKSLAGELPTQDVAVLRLPGYFSKRWTVNRVISELEEQNRRLLPEWQQAPMLKGELVLLLDESLTAHLSQTVLRYDRWDGLTWQKEEADEGSGI